MTKSEAMSVLGIKKKQLELLTEAGIVSHVPNSEMPLFSNGTVDRIALEAMVSRVRELAHATRGEDIEIIRFRDINLRRTTDRSAMLSVLRAIADGRIRALMFSSSDVLGEAGFDRHEVRAALTEWGAAVSLTAKDVSRMTGWKAECVRHWCAIGLIRSTMGRVGGIDAWRIDPAALTEFQQNYLVLSDVAARSATSSRALLRSLTSNGINTVGAMQAGNTSRGHLLPVSALGRLVNLEPT